MLPSFARIDEAVRVAWSAETTFAKPEYLARAPHLRSRAQCVSTSLVVHDLLGGDLMVAEVAVAGAIGGVHYWNRLSPSGLEIDLTRDQFLDDEIVGEPRRIERPPMPRPERAQAAYLLLRRRVLEDLGAPEVP